MTHSEVNSTATRTPNLTRFAWLSIAAAMLTILLKLGAYWLTGSVGLLSDGLEAFVNLAGALMALAMLAIAARPADEQHAYGHNKAEYFASGVEGTLILIAALSIAAVSIPRLINPVPLEQVGLGLAISITAGLINLAVAVLLMRAARQHRSITLEANARHLLTDVWTTVGVLVGLALVAWTGWLRLDPILALIVAANILWSGAGIMRQSIAGLMDVAWSSEEQAALETLLADYMRDGVDYHALRTRQAGARRFASLHLLVPGSWSVQRGHDLAEEIELDVLESLPNTTVFIHLEPNDDPVSWEDVELDRVED
jgi:cation diffusion facilitator family transporter